ncbi:MAG: YdcF family protein [Oscillospiraceae bacterium]|nr:YdcF family protein [Oscillospiraceae bacterium]
MLLKSGTPLSSIVAEDQSGWTKENALFSRKVSDEHGLTIRSAIIVCKSFHARRCLMCYQLAFPETSILIAPVDVYGISRDNWHMQAYGIDRVLGELARCGNQFTEEFKRNDYR